MTTRTTTIKVLAALSASLLLLGACSDDDTSSDDAGSTTVAEAPDTTTADTATSEAPATSEEPAVQWETVDAPADCQCGDGSPFQYFVRQANPAKVLFFMEGGGACFDKGTCGPDSESYKREVGDGPAERGGIFDFTNPANPFADWSVVYVPYCTGDVHIGNATTDYGDGVVVNHNGYINGTTALDAAAGLFPDAAQLVFAGESGGSIPSPLYAGLGSDLFPDASITVIADGSGAYPDVPLVNQLIGSQWGTMNAVPDWPENEGITVDTWSLPGLFVQAGKHAPEIVFARHDYAFDNTQVSFAGLAGIAADDLVSLIDQNEGQIEASGIDLWSFISPGDMHTILGKDDFYTHEVEGVTLLEWVTALVSGASVTDVHCTECTVAG